MAVYKIFDQTNDVISNIKDTVSSGMWENGSSTLTSFFTSSTQSGSSGTHYFDVYGTNPQTTTTAKAQFSRKPPDLNGFTMVKHTFPRNRRSKNRKKAIKNQ